MCLVEELGPDLHADNLNSVSGRNKTKQANKKKNKLKHKNHMKSPFQT